MCYLCKTPEEHDACGVNDRIKALYDALEDVGLEPEAGPSNISGSPHDYLYVYLSPKHIEGPHVLLSDGTEMPECSDTPSDPGLLVGYYKSYEAFEGGDHDPCQEVATVQEAVDLTRQLVSDHVWGQLDEEAAA